MHTAESYDIKPILSTLRLVATTPLPGSQEILVIQEQVMFFDLLDHQPMQYQQGFLGMIKNKCLTRLATIR